MSDMKWECQECFAEFAIPMKKKRGPMLIITFDDQFVPDYTLVCPVCGDTDIMSPEDRIEYDDIIGASREIP